MPVESWTAPEETPALAATATAMIDAALVGSGLARDDYWAAVRKGYNTPYNDPQRKGSAQEIPAAVIGLTEAPPLPIAAMAQQNAPEIRAA